MHTNKKQIRSRLMGSRYMSLPAIHGAGGGAQPGAPALPGEVRSDGDGPPLHGRRLCEEAVRGVHHPQRGVHGERPARLLQGHQDRQDPGAPVSACPLRSNNGIHVLARYNSSRASAVRVQLPPAAAAERAAHL